METPVQTADRLLQAFAALVAEEAGQVRAGRYDLAAAARERAAPLVARLVALAVDPEVATRRGRVNELLQQSEETAALLRQRIAEVKGELRRVGEARQRIAQVAPAYGRPARAPAPRFAAAG